MQIDILVRTMSLNLNKMEEKQHNRYFMQNAKDLKERGEDKISKSVQVVNETQNQNK
jgi:hypothetical protein